MSTLQSPKIIASNNSFRSKRLQVERAAKASDINGEEETTLELTPSINTFLRIKQRTPNSTLHH
ncbi:hypothetical protein LguiA_012306 [Lonicera macranthoides]